MTKGVMTHIRTHGAIHAVWTIAILLAVISWLLLGERDGTVIRDYIAFAASVASLVLAVVAIFYTLFSNQSFSETIGALKSTAENVHTAARNIAESSATLAEHSERMIGEVSRVPSAVEALSARMEAAFAQPQAPGPPSEQTGYLFEDTEGTRPIGLYNETVSGGKASLYIISLAHVRGRSFNPSEIFAGTPGEVVWTHFVGGYIDALRVAQPFGLKLAWEEREEGAFFSVLAIGEIPASKIIQDYSQAGATHEPVRTTIDKYFFPTSSDSPPEADA